ncbi:unnamed protein product, partial [Cylicostephanus goldi]
SDDELDYEDGLCDNCGEECRTLQPIDEVKLCYVCRMYYKHLVSKEDRRDDDGSSRRDRVRGSHTWTEEERMIAFHFLGTKTPDKVKSFYTEMKEDIDKLLEKEIRADEELVTSFDVEKELGAEATKPVEIVNLD